MVLDSITNLPDRPKDFQFPRYVLPETFGRMEEEEVAARIITFCQQNGNAWCKIPLDAFISAIDLEYVAIRQDGETRRHILQNNREKEGAYLRELFLYRLKMLLTFGLYTFFQEAPNKPELLPLPESAPPMTGAFFGIRHIIDGINGLREKGVIGIDTEGGSHLIVPTVHLIEPLGRYRQNIS